MSYFLFILYLFAGTWLVGRLNFFRKRNCNTRHLQLFFIIKVAVGCFYGMLYATMPKGGDTWRYHRYGLSEWKVLQSDPVYFFTSLFQSNYAGGIGGFLDTRNSWWNDLDENLMARLMGLFNVFSGGHYYTNVILFSLLTFLGPVLLCMVWKAVLPGAKTFWHYLPFLFPNFLFWTSGMHKEGIILLGLGLVVYSLYFGWQQGRFTLRKCLALLTGMLIILVLRNILFLALGGAIFAWLLAQKLPFRPWATYLGTLLLLGVMFFGAKYIHPKLDLPQVVATRQSRFMVYKSASKVAVTPLEPHFSSFAKSTPDALVRATFRPFPNDVHNKISAAAAAESIVLMVLVVAGLCLSYRCRWQNKFLLFCLSFSLLVLLSIGYTIPILGAVVRYRSLVLPFILMPLCFVLANFSMKKTAVSPSKAAV